ncbi:RTP1-C1 domain-containing protein [Mycena kentingensis (nom. inval.)]|nr:RTP1-C1 domain-containing protein [Mycena kentingensis (nom. inval.)]
MDHILRAGLCLVESSENQTDLKNVLIQRLVRYYATLKIEPAPVNASDSLDSIQLRTALESLNTLQSVHEVLVQQDLPVGTRDMAEIRTLLAITFRWAVNPLLSRAILIQPKPSRPTVVSEDFKQLRDIISRLLGVGIAQNPSTFVTTTLLTRHLDQLLRAGIALGWLAAPDSVVGLIKTLVTELLDVLSPSETIAALGTALSGKPCPPYIRKTCSSLLTKQLLRPEGVRGLCAAIFGENAEEAQLEKLEHVARVLTTPPASISAEEYFPAIIPSILDLLSERAPPSYRRAGAFSISRMLFIPACIGIFSTLHGPFLPSSTPSASAQQALSTLTTLVTNIDPSPNLISSLISPILSSLYSLLYHLDKTKATDPTLKETVRGIVAIWGRVIGAEEAIAIIWSIIDGEGGFWTIGLDGHIGRTEKQDVNPGLGLLTPADEEIDVDTNFLDLYPDPAHFVGFIKSLQRADISSDLFLRLLESYRQSKDEETPTRPLLYLQIVVQMQQQLADGPSTILGKPKHMLSFIRHTLDPQSSSGSQPPTISARNPFDFGLQSKDDNLEGDSDDEDSGENVVGVDDEMMETAINLLLAILEGNQELTAQTAPELNDIFTLLQPIALSGSASLQPLAREARMVITARLASTSGSKRPTREADVAQETYQKALKLLQDPILPVRAHGLLLLRQLVSAKSASGTSSTTSSALAPAILSIFLQSLQDDDSYIFLNAVQGLAAMVDLQGKDVLRGLVLEYTQGLDGLGSGNISTRDMDVRTRIGEALSSVIRRCGDALPGYVDLIVPPLFNTVRNTQIPITLRTSALSLLGECENTCALALIPYTVDLAEAMVDLLQIETNTSGPTESEDVNPTLKNSKQPPFRRAALHFLGLLIRETGCNPTRPIFSGSVLKRIKTTLGYIAVTDADAIVRVMAREVGENLGELAETMLGT